MRSRSTTPLPKWYTRPKTVTHPGSNRARRALTSFMRRTPLTTTPRRQPCVCVCVCRLQLLTLHCGGTQTDCEQPVVTPLPGPPTALLLHTAPPASSPSDYALLCLPSLQPITTNSQENGERNRAENYNKWHNEYMFFKNCNQHFGNFKQYNTIQNLTF